MQKTSCGRRWRRERLENEKKKHEQEKKDENDIFFVDMFTRKNPDKVKASEKDMRK